MWWGARTIHLAVSGVHDVVESVTSTGTTCDGWRGQHWNTMQRLTLRALCTS